MHQPRHATTNSNTVRSETSNPTPLLPLPLPFSGSDGKSVETGQGESRRDGVLDRRGLPDRRAMLEAKRRAKAQAANPDAESGDRPGFPQRPEAALTSLDRRRGPGRRLSDFTRSAEEGEMTTEQFLFLMAIDAFKKANSIHYPSWTDVLEVVRLLGYRKTMPMEIALPAAEDWCEVADTSSNVRPDRWSNRKAA